MTFKRLQLRLVLLLFIALWHQQNSAQECTYILTGRVVDLHDGTPIFGSVIRILETGQFAQTNEKGFYRILNICRGEIRLEISHPECQTIERNISMPTNEEFLIELEHHINALEEIVLSEQSQSNVNKSVLESRLQQQQMDRYSIQSLADALSSLTGINAVKTGNAIAKPMIHGMYGSRVGIVTQGIRLQDQEWGADHAPNIDLNAFESVQVVKGASALKYGGDTAGGVVVLNSFKVLPRDSLYRKTKINAASNGRGGSVSSQWIKSYNTGYYFSGQITGKRFGDLSAPDYILSNTGLKEWNLNWRVGRTKVRQGWEVSYSRFQNETAILKASHIGNTKDLLQALKFEKPLYINPFSYTLNTPKQSGVHHNFQFTLFDQFSDESRWRFDYNYQRNTRKEFDIRRGERANLPAIDLLLQTHSLLAHVQKNVGTAWRMEWGINALFQDNYSNPDTGVKRLIPDYLKYQLGSYFTGNYQHDNAWVWEWGIRADGIRWDVQKYYLLDDWRSNNYDQLFPEFEDIKYSTQILTHPKINYLTFSLHNGFSIRHNDELKSSISYILSQRSPNAAELFSDGLHHSLATIEMGNLTLKKEISHKFLYALTLNKVALSFAFEPYAARVKNYIYLAPKEVRETIRGAFPVWSYNATQVGLWGVDADVKLPFSKQLQLYVKVSYVNIQDLTNKRPMILTPPFNSTQSLVYTFPKSQFSIEIENHFVAKQSRFPDFNVEVDVRVGDLIESQIVDFSTPPDAYNITSINFLLPLKLTDGLNSQLRLMFNNVTQTSYRDYLNRMRYFVDEVGRNVQFQLILNY